MIRKLGFRRPITRLILRIAAAVATRLRDAPFVDIVRCGCGEERIVNKIIWGAVLAMVVSCAGTPVVAAERAARSGLLPPHEIVTVVRSTGLVPLGRPTRRGNDYVLRARDEIGQQVRVVVDGRVGEVRSVVPVALGRRGRDADEPPYPSIFESGPPVYDRRLPIDSPPIIIEEDDAPPVYRRAAPPVVPPAIMPPPAEREALPPSPQFLTTPRPPGAVPTAPPTAALPESESEENVLLPPPPPRFPQRVPPNVKPQQKPTQSAAKPAAAKKPDAKKSDSSPSREAEPATSAPPAAGSNAPPLQLQN
jgi:hypothetical protein